MARLREYERKRDPKKTPEPFGGKRGRRKEPIFVVQRHQARALHYDFRLERDGALASWAVPKGVPLENGSRVFFGSRLRRYSSREATRALYPAGSAVEPLWMFRPGAAGDP